MKALILCVAVNALSLIAFAQKAPAKFGEVPIEQLKMTSYPKDSSASAVILVDFGESSMPYSQNSGFSISFKRYTRIKILTKDGLEWANFEVPLYHDGSKDEKLSGLRAITYNLENGKVVETKLKNEGIFKEKRDNNVDVMKITLPNAKVGSVLEITYEVNSDFLFNFQDWQFQYTIPVAWSEYRARIPEYFSYDKYSQGYVMFDVNEETTASNSITLTSTERSAGDITNKTTFEHDRVDYQETRYRWAAANVPAFRSEPYLTTYRDYISQINFELAYTKFPNQGVKEYMGSWEKINSTYVESSDFGGEVTGNGFLKKHVDEIIADKKNPEEIVSAIFDYVKYNIAWDGKTRKFITSSLRQIMENKKGNSADINLLLASMLEKAGIAVYPVLISTRDHGFLREGIPVSSQFNNVICLVKLGDKNLLLDATEKLLPIGFLPERCLNGKGLVISKSGHSWIPLIAPMKSRTAISGDFALSDEGSLTGKIQFDRLGYDAQNMRQKYFSKGEPEYIKDQYGQHSWDLVKSEFQNAKELHQSFKEIHQLEIRDHITKAGDMIYLNPFVKNDLSENPFKIENRQYPVDFGYAFDKIYSFRYAIPEGYQVEEMPKVKAFVLPENAGKYSYNVSQNGNIITITSMMQINKSLFSQLEYPNLKEFYNQIIAKQSEQIILKKK